MTVGFGDSNADGRKHRNEYFWCILSPNDGEGGIFKETTKMEYIYI